jgi:hypothetical protein
MNKKHEEHICAYNDGEQSCDCYNEGYDAGLKKGKKIKNKTNYPLQFMNKLKSISRNTQHDKALMGEKVSNLLQEYSIV